MFLVDEIVLAASAKVLALSRAVVVSSGLLGLQLISLTARRYRSVAAKVITSLLISTWIPLKVGSESSRPAATATWLTAVANKSLAIFPEAVSYTHLTLPTKRIV